MEQIDELKKRLGEAEKKIQLFDKIMWVVAALALIFGLTGAFGARALSSAKQEITELQTDLATLQETLSSWKQEVEKGVGALKNQEQESLAAMQRKHDSFLRRWSAIPKQSIEDVRKQESSSVDALQSHWVMVDAKFKGETQKAHEAIAASAEQVKQELRTAADKLIRDAQRLYTTRKEFDSFRNSLVAGGLSIKCKRLQIMGQGETAVAELSADDDGGKIQVFNAQAKAVGLFSSSANGGMIEVLNAQSKLAAGLACSAGGAGSLHLCSKEGKPFLFAGVSGEGAPLLSLRDHASERNLVQLWTDKDGGNIQVLNAQAKLASRFSCSADGAGCLSLYGRAGKRFLWAGLSTEGAPRLLLEDPKSEGRVVELCADKDGGNIKVLNAQAKPACWFSCSATNGAGSLSLYSKAGKRFLWAGLYSNTGEPAMTLTSPKTGAKKAMEP